MSWQTVRCLLQRLLFGYLDPFLLVLRVGLVLVLTIFNEGTYLTSKTFFHKAHSLIVKSRSDPFLEPTSTKLK